MLKYLLRQVLILSVSSIFLLFAAAAQSIENPSAIAYPENWHSKEGCGANRDGAFVLVTIRDMLKNEGNVRAQIYDSNADTFLDKGKYLSRLVVKANYSEEVGQYLCLVLPSEGIFALYILHDRNGNLKTDFLTDGFGFSNNPKMGLGAPSHKKVTFSAHKGVTMMDIRLNYVVGADNKQIKRRRRAKRR